MTVRPTPRNRWFAAVLMASMVALVLTLGVIAAPRARAADDRLDFTATTLGGAPFNGASLQGKPAVLWFWTPWCPFCNAEGPAASQVAAANPGVTFVGIAAHSDVGAMQGFVSKYGLNFTNINDADGAIWARYNVPCSRPGCSIGSTVPRPSSTTPPRPCPSRNWPTGSPR